VTVASVDDATSRAAELGANVIAEPFDVMDVGRMSTIADPAGAALCLWEPRKHPGAAYVNAPGAMSWNDLVTPDPEGAARFYGGLFGWTAEEMPNAMGYRIIKNGERSNGGIMPVGPERANTSPFWMPYFGHEDLDRLIGEVDGLGGRLFDGPHPVPAGKFAMFGDPEGAVFAVLWTGDYDD
jgi:predicted enzyme related to lactoylglutathione lyase